MTFFKTSLCLIAAGTLAACGGGSTGGTSFSSLEQRAEDALSQTQRLQSLSPTAFDAMPTSGSATFTGVAGMIIDPVPTRSNDDISILGDSELRANFRAGTVTGDIDNMVFVRGSDEVSGDFGTVGGRIVVGENLSIIGNDEDDNLTSRPNDWFADYIGELTVEGQQWTVFGDFEGQFLGTRVNSDKPATKAIFGIALNGLAMPEGGRDGDEVFAPIEVIGEAN